MVYTRGAVMVSIAIEPELFELAAYSLPDMITFAYQIVGYMAALVCVILFTVWGAWHAIRFLRQMLHI